jgi:hypothetical protein
MRLSFKHLVLLASLVSCVLLTACSSVNAAQTATGQAQATELAAIQEQTQQSIQETAAAAMTLTAMTLTAMPTATPRPTATPTHTPTPLPTATFTPTPLPTDTPTPDAPPSAVLTANANLRSGPGVAYAVVVSLTSGTTVEVLEQDPQSTWFRVQVEGSDTTGWISMSLVTYDFDINSIPVAEVIPPTPTFAPVVPTTPAEPLNYDVHIAVTNDLEVAVTVYLSGTYTTSFTVQSGQTITVDVPSGSYGYTAYAYGYSNLNGSKSWDPGDWTWEFYAA